MCSVDHNYRVQMVRHNNRAIHRNVMVVIWQVLQFMVGNESEVREFQDARKDRPEKTLAVSYTDCYEIETG